MSIKNVDIAIMNGCQHAAIVTKDITVVREMIAVR